MAERRELPELFFNVIKKMGKQWQKQINPGINHSQFIILKTLNSLGPQKATELAEIMHVTPGAVTGATDKLVSEGYAERKGSKGDRRVVYLEITESGKALVETILQEQIRFIEKFFEGLSDDDINHLYSIYNKILDNLDSD